MTVGFLVVDKPGGITSHDVVSRVRRASGVKKAGHAGTLDPMATGAVVVAIGRATRLIRFLQDLPKEYVATARLNVATDSLDADGEVVWRGQVGVETADLCRVAGEFTGSIMQTPPMVSAIKVGGERLYEKARRGEVVERLARQVVVHDIEVLEHRRDLSEFDVRVVCGKGTYVRVLADDIASRLGTRAHLTALRRTRIGRLTVADYGIVVDDLPAGWEGALLTPAEALADLPAVAVDAAAADQVSHGRPLPAGILPDQTPMGPVRVLGSGGRLLAIYRPAGDLVRPEVVMV